MFTTSLLDSQQLGNLDQSDTELIISRWEPYGLTQGPEELRACAPVMEEAAAYLLAENTTGGHPGLVESTIFLLIPRIYRAGRLMGLTGSAIAHQWGVYLQARPIKTDAGLLYEQLCADFIHGLHPMRREFTLNLQLVTAQPGDVTQEQAEEVLTKAYAMADANGLKITGFTWDWLRV
jgi:hypothetical protein